MPKRQIQCEHNIPISECAEHYPIFLRETSVGDYLDNPLGFSNDTMMQGFQNTLLILALNHNAAIVEYAAALISAGPPKDRRAYRKAIDQFRTLHKNFSKEYEKTLKDAVEEFEGK